MYPLSPKPPSGIAGSQTRMACEAETQYDAGIPLAASNAHWHQKNLLTNLFSRHYKGYVHWMSQCSFFWMNRYLCSVCVNAVKS